MALYAALHRITTKRVSTDAVGRTEYDVLASKGSGRSLRIGSVYKTPDRRWGWTDCRGRHQTPRYPTQRTMAGAVWAVAQLWIEVQPEP